MAESIIAHFRTADRAAVTTAVCGIAPPAGNSGADRAYPAPDVSTLTIYPYDDLVAESEPEELVELQAALGGLPSTSIAIELRRSAGDRAVDDATMIVTSLLTVFDGVVDDTDGGLWTGDDIARGVEKSQGAFLACYRAVATLTATPARLPSNPSDEAILEVVEAWIDALAQGEYDVAFAMTEHDPHNRWTPDLMRRVVAGYGLPTPHPSGTVFAVTLRADADGSPADRAVDREIARGQVAAEARYSLPLNGEWPDLHRDVPGAVRW